MNQLLLTLLVSLTLFLGNISIAFSAPKPITEDLEIGKRYQQATLYYNQLETKSKLSTSRDNWLKCTRNFRKIYLSSPKSEYAPTSLFMQGRIYLRMYEKFGQNIDIQESLSYYKDSAALFKNNRLADDSLFAVGKIYLNHYSNPEKAAHYFKRIITDYPSGDMHPRAVAKLKKLSKDSNIAVPDIAITNTQFKQLSNVHPVKYWSSADYTRIVIKATEPVTYRDQLLPQKGKKPRRLTLDFSNCYVAPQYRAPIPIPTGLLKKIHTSQSGQKTVRVSLDIESVSSYNIFSLPDPFRVVVDVRGSLPSQKKIPTIKKPRRAKTILKVPSSELVILRDHKKTRFTTVNQAPLSLVQQLGLGVKKIVIDPGHGGKDPGAIANGLKEKDIVLHMAKKLKGLLVKKLGCEVVITRTGDQFISLEERTAIANTNNADLFISLHVNASTRKKAHGLETYFLNLSTNAEAIRVAARENATSELRLSDLQNILSDIMKNSKRNESSKLASFVHNSILSGLKKSNYSNVKNLGVKQAPFYVLIGAEMPSILIEMAFISNHEDAKNLRQEQYLDTFAQEIVTGIQAYMNANTASL